MKTYYLNKLSAKEITSLLKRPAINYDNIIEKVGPVVRDVKANGIEAAIKYSKQFDGFDGSDIKIAAKEIASSSERISAELKRAIDIAADNIRKFHSRQLPKGYETETMPGVKCSREYRAIENVGLYIPGGSAVLFSTMLMLGIPAKLAGCKRIVAFSPAKNGKVNDALLYAANVAGVDEFYKLGGAQAIALMAYGDNEFKKVDKVFGPGSQYVTVAKSIISTDPDGCTIDMPAGPSEVLVIADDSAVPAYVASDLLSQAEHGADSQVILLTTSEKLAQEVNKEIEKQVALLPRNEIAVKALESSFVLITNSVSEAFDFSNKYAPEHLILSIDKAESYKQQVQNAGSVFLGNHSPESAGDYASGTNHSLPTYGYAKSFSGVNVESFMKAITFQNLSETGLKGLSETIINLAEAESLQAHANAVKVRIKK